VTPKREAFILMAWLAAALLLAALTWHVQAASGPLAADRHAAELVAALRSEPLTSLMRSLHAVQGKLVAVALVFWATVLVRRRRWQALVWLLTMVPLGMLANSGFKLLVERPRPGLEAAVGSHGFSYPSGHAVAITLCCGYLLVQIFRRTTRWSWRIAALACALAVVGLVALSRVYLGVHHPSDVVASMLLGIAWLGMCLSGRFWLERAARSAVR
jgi:membrane-associated phospholipid phosphatase